MRDVPRWKIFLRAMLGRGYPRLIGMQREKSWLFFDILLPFMATSAYVLVYEALGAPEAFKGFVLLGGAMTAFWTNVLWSMAMQLYWDKEVGNLQLYMITPAPLMAVLAGMALGGMAATALRAAGILVAGSLLFDIRYHVANLPALIAIFLISLIALYGLGMLLASIFLVYGRGAWQITATLQEGVYFISGFYFPVRSLGFWVAAAASIIPLTLGLDAMRQLLYPDMLPLRFLSLRAEGAILSALAVVFLSAAYAALRGMERKSRSDGRLTERGN
ncbi:MAG: ABC transporter [Herpetosiphonaceae bacterium]|nr:MAG: ABC transporter [Herpetosiphonaceae bacterium]